MTGRQNFLGKVILSLTLMQSSVSCQHLAGVSSSKCKEPKFEMMYVFSSVMPSYMALDVDFSRADGDLVIKLGTEKKPSMYEITAKQVESRGIYATIRNKLNRNVVDVSGLLIKRDGINDPFLLIVETDMISGRRYLKLTVAETSYEKNMGVLSDAEVVAGFDKEVVIDQMLVSAHHQERDVSNYEDEQIGVEKLFLVRKKNGRIDKVLDFNDFQNLAEQYLDCTRQTKQVESFD